MAIGVKCDERQEVEMTWFKGRRGNEELSVTRIVRIENPSTSIIP